MGPLAWSTLWLLIVVASAVVVIQSWRLRRECRHAGSREHATEATEELTAQVKKRPTTAFGWAFAVTFAYWACMFAFYLTSLNSTDSLRFFFAVWAVATVPAVIVSLVLSFWFLRAGAEAVRRSTMRGPLVTGIETRAALLVGGWIGVALFATLFSITAYQHGF
jgi:hypothetical protein